MCYGGSPAPNIPGHASRKNDSTMLISAAIASCKSPRHFAR